MDRREFLKNTVYGGAAALTGATTSLAAKVPLPKATADTCILVWLAGGMCHLDTLDPKRRGDGAGVAGSYYNSIKTAVSGIEVCEHLPRLAERMDRIALVRSLHHQFGNHTQAVDFVHTGRLPSGTVVYPSLGSVVAHELGGFDPKAPAYVVIGEPMQPRGPGFLGGAYNYIYVTDTEAGPAGLRPPRGVSLDEYQERVQWLKEFSGPYRTAQAGVREVDAYLAAADRGIEMMAERIQSAFSVKEEPAGLRDAYGEEFGQRLLLSRRMVEHGIRFVECSFNLKFVNGYGWDSHSFAQRRVHFLIRQLDQALTVLIDDLDRRKMFDRTLVVIGTDFGRPPEFDGTGGRGHQSSAYSTLLFGGGIKGGQVVGSTDELGRTIVSRPVTIPDYHATIYRALGVNPDKPLSTPDSRPVPITDYGKPVEELFV
jgi:hypothetical protein